MKTYAPYPDPMPFSDEGTERRIGKLGLEDQVTARRLLLEVQELGHPRNVGGDAMGRAFAGAYQGASTELRTLLDRAT